MIRKAILSRKIFIALGALFLCLPSRADAWGWWQHEIIAEIAEQNLSPSARKAITGILGSDTRLKDVSTWADQVRHLRPRSAPWHYINYPLELAEPDYDIRNTPEGNVVTAIETEIALLRDPDAGRTAREEALKFRHW